MPSNSFVTAFTAGLVFLSSFTVAKPINDEGGLMPVKRYATNYIGCSDDQKKKLEHAFGDAVTLAKAADHIDHKSKAWSHYFRTEGDGEKEDAKYAKSMWKALAANNDSKHPKYSFSVRCGTNDDTFCKGGKSLAITDARPMDGDTLREMLVCPLFFDDSSKETVNNLDSREFAKPKRGLNSWCAPGNNFGWYEVAGHTLLHEMTHLDAIGKAAGLPETKEDGFSTHGTNDVDGLGKSYPVAARSLAAIWQKNKEGSGTLPTYKNAENLAGAALEWYMTHKCKKAGEDIGEIPL